MILPSLSTVLFAHHGGFGFNLNPLETNLIRPSWPTSVTLRSG
jgi:hypothetical protein